MLRESRRILRAQARAAGLRRHRRWKMAMALLFCLAVGSAIWSHVRAPSDARAADGRRVEVVSVLDGDTLVIRTPVGETERVRLRGIDAPEIRHNGKPASHFAEEAKTYLARRIGRNPVILQFDGTQIRDRYGRLLAFVYVNETDNLNLDLVRTGHAYADRRFDSYLRAQLSQAEREAREKSRGLWKDLTPEQMPDWRQEWLKRQANQAKPPAESDGK